MIHGIHILIIAETSACLLKTQSHIISRLHAQIMNKTYVILLVNEFSNTCLPFTEFRFVVCVAHTTQTRTTIS